MNNELYHYGVRGMKWGVRRYQNANGTLTAEGRKRARQEYKEDKGTSYDLGKNATVYGHAAARSTKRTIRIENKLDKQYEKDPAGVKNRTRSLTKEWQASATTTEQLTQKYAQLRDKAEAHCKSLIDKYGQDAVTAIKYKDIKLPKSKHAPDSFKTINERTNNASDYLTALGSTAAAVGTSQLFNLPVTLIFAPRTTYEKARDVELGAYLQNWKAIRKATP